MSPTPDELFEKYKSQPFGNGLLAFTAAVKSLDKPVPAIFAKQDGKQRWVICETGSDRPALFSYAAVMSQSDDEKTGNFVPAGQEIPSGVEPKVIQIRPNSKCFYTYIFDTYSDWTLYEGQWALDAYMSSLKDFNPKNLPRRSYLSGQEEKYRSKFWMQTPMFLRRGPREPFVPAPEHLHAWVLKADKDSTPFKANPDRPRVWVKMGDAIVPISEREPGRLQRGDSVVVSFSVTYHLTSVNWFAQFHPADIVVLKSWDGDATDYSGPVMGLHGRPPPTLDVFESGGGAMEDIDDGGAPVVQVAAGTHVGGMGWAEGSAPPALSSVQDGVDAQESMEIDEGQRPSNAAGSGGGVTINSALIGDFDVINALDEEDARVGDEFVEVSTELVESRSSKPSGHKGGRTGRKGR